MSLVPDEVRTLLDTSVADYLIWFTRTYARGAKPADGLAFDPHLLPKTSPVPPQTLASLMMK